MMQGQSINARGFVRPCAYCGTPFYAAAWRLRRRSAVYCSRPCYYAGRVRPLSARVWSKVRRTATCWLWTGATNRSGYGWVNRGARGAQPMLAHRFTFEETYGPIPEGLGVLHRCDRPACVRPEHLFLGTQADNSADMVAKGRQRRGERRPGAVLTDAIVREARVRHAAGGISILALARQYGVNGTVMWDVLNGTRWKHVL